MVRRTQAAAYAVRVFGDHHDDGAEPHYGPGVDDVDGERLPAGAAAINPPR